MWVRGRPTLYAVAGSQDHATGDELSQSLWDLTQGQPRSPPPPPPPPKAAGGWVHPAHRHRQLPASPESR